jgi:hypothetical protein
MKNLEIRNPQMKNLGIRGYGMKNLEIRNPQMKNLRIRGIRNE